ncbi:hypothetical protein ACFQ3L_06665 [Lacticaseibacillus jixianensis]|uniref:DUF1700 domain-containing protein n=1 Tax=Lacticaseibacillus jixianensis TaxID=2486012 RepID=A0ABW4BAN0_9LACO|nr:hypothetical protein [Lacticaseibacillus jixianensis]
MDLFTENDERLKQLHGLNKMYAETLIGYLRAYRGKDALAREDTIEDLLTDMVAAQADGITSKDHFGKDPQAAADEILSELPRAPKAQWLLLYWPLVNSLWDLVFVFGISLLLTGETVNVNTLLGWLVLPVFFIAVAPLFRGLGFNHIQRKTKWRASIALVLIIAFYAVLFAIPDMPALKMSVLQTGSGVAVAILVVCNLVMSFSLRRLALPWLLYWLIVGPSALALLGGGLPLGLAVVLLLVFMVAGAALNMYQSTHLHFVFQAQGGKRSQADR